MIISKKNIVPGKEGQGSGDSFRFRQFTVRQELCGMKVGTDGTLLGAWARGGKRILDVGTGTGLIALMMAQRYQEAQVVGIDIDDGAVAQAIENVAASPFAERIDIVKCDFTLTSQISPLTSHPSPLTSHLSPLTTPFNAIVCNPPFFVASLKSPDAQRSLARHADTLPYRRLMERSWQLLSDDGELSVVVPTDSCERMESEAVLAGFFKCRDCAVSTAPGKAPKRHLLAFRKHPTALERGVLTIGSTDYVELTKEFYL